MLVLHNLVHIKTYYYKFVISQNGELAKLPSTLWRQKCASNVNTWLRNLFSIYVGSDVPYLVVPVSYIWSGVKLLKANQKTQTQTQSQLSVSRCGFVQVKRFFGQKTQPTFSLFLKERWHVRLRGAFLRYDTLRSEVDLSNTYPT